MITAIVTGLAIVLILIALKPEKTMKLERTHRGLVIRSDTNTLPVVEIGRGSYTQAFKHKSTVYLRTLKQDKSKEFMCSLPRMFHLPRCEKLEEDKDYFWYKMPLYYPVPLDSEADQHYKAIQEIYDTAKNKTNMSGEIKASNLPKALKNALLTIQERANKLNSKNYFFDLHRKNFVVNKSGKLVLLDVIVVD